jgi:hypothetical protein
MTKMEKTIKSAFIGLMGLLILIAVPSLAVATLMGPAYPPPGGGTATTSDDPQAAGLYGGFTWTFTGFDPTAYGDLYWGAWENLPSEPVTIGVSLNDSSVTGSEVMSFNSYSGNQATWTGQTSMIWKPSSSSSWQSAPIDTVFILTVTDSMDNPISLEDAIGHGLGANVGAIAPVSGDFKANLQFLGRGFPLFAPTNYYPVYYAFNYHETNPNVSTHHDFSGGFYYTAAIPDPSMVFLLGSACLIGFAGARKKFKK